MGCLHLKDKEKHVLGHDKMEDFLIRFEIPYIALDTDKMDSQQVLETAKRKILDIRKGINR